jgi:glutamate synthase domain-containing protein 2
VLPAAKVSKEISEIRGVEMGQDCISPARHSAFATPIELMQFIAALRSLSGGKPTGFKLCIGHPWEFLAVVKAMLKTGITPDFIVIDGKEGGTGAAPLEFMDHLGMPLREGLTFVHSALIGANLRDKIKLGAAGKIVSGFDMARVMALGADWCNAARGFMFAVGCLQSQQCHTDRCPTGVATQDPWLSHGLDPDLKSVRAANYIKTLRRDLLKVAESCGVLHPALISTDDVDVLYGDQNARRLWEVYDYEPGWGRISERDAAAIRRIMSGAPEGGSAPASATAQG